MKFAIIGTGMVGRTVGGKLTETGHSVMLGTRDVSATMSRSATETQGSQPFAAWKEQNQEVKLGTFAEAAAYGEIVVNATPGGVSLDALKTAGAANLKGKILAQGEGRSKKEAEQNAARAAFFLLKERGIY